MTLYCCSVFVLVSTKHKAQPDGPPCVHTKPYQCGVGGVELGEDVPRVAEHGGHDRPLGRHPLDDVARNEDGGDDQEEVDDRERGGADASNLKRS